MNGSALSLEKRHHMSSYINLCPQTRNKIAFISSGISDGANNFSWGVGMALLWNVLRRAEEADRTDIVGYRYDSTTSIKAAGRKRRR